MAAKPDLEKGKAPVTETTSLLGSGRKSMMAGGEALLSGDPMAFMVKDDVCVTDYDPETLTNWKALLQFEGSIFRQKAMWAIVFMQLATALGIAGLLYFFARNPNNYSSDSMTQVIKTMTVSIAFLLGMFLSACLGRWWDTVKSIESLFGSIKKLLMTAINLELPREFCESLARACVLSVIMMEFEMTLPKMKGKQEDNWKKRFDELEENGQITIHERSVLEQVPPMERSFFSWSIVSSELCDVRDDLTTGGVPDTVAYDRLCELVGVGTSSVSALKTLMTFQIPFIYVHMLGFMVHAVNIMTALGAGVSIGLNLSRSRRTGIIDFPAITNELMFLLIQAFLYQSFLTIGAALSFPVTGEAYKIPLRRMITTLERQLGTMSKLSISMEQERQKREAGLAAGIGAGR
jgi:hypothetical protein